MHIWVDDFQPFPRLDMYPFPGRVNFYRHNSTSWTKTPPKISPFMCCNTVLAGGNSKIFYFHPEIWGNDPIWRSYFSNGLVQPPTSVMNTGFERVLNWTSKVQPRTPPKKKHPSQCPPTRNSQTSSDIQVVEFGNFLVIQKVFLKYKMKDLNC